MDRDAVEEPVHVFRLAAVAAEQAMVAQQPQVAWVSGRLVGGLGHLVGIAEAIPDAWVEQLGQLVLVEAEEAEVVAHPLQLGQLDRQEVVVPIR
jgi:hypothetical protein